MILALPSRPAPLHHRISATDGYPYVCVYQATDHVYSFCGFAGFSQQNAAADACGPSATGSTEAATRFMAHRRSASSLEHDQQVEPAGKRSCAGTGESTPIGFGYKTSRATTTQGRTNLVRAARVCTDYGAFPWRSGNHHSAELFLE
jgi:hypothetical protein